MSDDDLIRRGDALAAVQGFGYGWHAEEVIAALPAVKHGIKPLVWFEAELPSRGGGKYTAEGYTIRKIEGLWLLDFAGEGRSKWRWTELDAAKAAAQADYEARILAALEPAPTDTAQVRAPFFFDRYINGVRMAEDVCIERETTLEGAMQVAARIAAKGPNGEAPVLVYRASAAQAREAKSWDELSDGQIYAAMSAIQQETKTSRKAAILEAANVCKVFQSNARTNDAWLHACEIEEAILALIGEKPREQRE